MIFRRLLLTCLLILGTVEAQAAMCDVRTATPTFADLTAMGLLSCDTSGNLRVTIGTLLSGEDQTNNLLMTSGGAVRGTEGNLINSAVGDATSAAFTLPTGPKTITGRITGAGSVAQVIKIHAGTSSGFTVLPENVLCTLTLSGTSGATGTEAICPVITAPILFYKAVTSGSSGTPTTILTGTY